MRALPLLAAVLLLAFAAPARAAPDPLRGQQWNLDLVEADAAHGTATGAGAVVAVIDSGVHGTHEDLVGRLIPGRDFVSGDDDPADANGHGTHVTGIVVASKENGRGIAGVAPGATVLPLRVLGDDGTGTTDGAAAAIDYAVDHGAHVINLSLGSDIPLIGSAGEPRFNAALGRAADAGVTIVAAAGNNGVPVCEQPSVAGRLVCVGAVDRRSMRAAYSSSPGPRGVMAPGGSALPVVGEDVLSTYNDGRYLEVAGTSQAAPHVSGIAALLVSLGVRGQAVADRILATATDTGSPGHDELFGAGIANARAAVAGLQPPGGGAKGTASLARVHRISTVLRKGIRVRCRGATAGRCTARVRAGHTTIAYGSARVKAGRTVTLVARATKAGRRRLRNARRVSAAGEIAIPGARTKTKSLVLRR
jgi:serine protease